MLAYLKCALDVLNAVAACVAYTSPNPTPKVYVKKGLSEAYMRWILHGLKIYACTLILIDAVATLAVSSDSPTATSIVETLCPSLRQPSITILQRPSTIFLIASGITISLGYVRYTCYKTLGRLFTYEVTIQTKHKLITTGPYAVVRHPSYIAGIFCTFTLLAVFVSRGTYSKECLLTRSSAILWNVATARSWDWAALCASFEGLVELTSVELVATMGFVVWFILVLLLTMIVIRRLDWEERVLNDEFKEQWVEYTRVVPWKVIPGIM